MPFTEMNNHLCNILVNTGGEPLEYLCSERPEVIESRLSGRGASVPTIMAFQDKDNHTIYVRTSKVLAVETVYSHGG